MPLVSCRWVPGAWQEVARLTEMNQSLSHSKAGMQRSMMEEVARVQAALNEAKRENAQLRQLAHPLPTVGSTDRFQQVRQRAGFCSRD